MISDNRDENSAAASQAHASNLMLGFETSDDASVYRINDEVAALTTVDFFTPIVDDPYDFGRITAANSLSDIYAMGGTPLTVLNLIAFPCSLGPEVVGAVVRGGAHVVAEAGAVVVGGHTIDDKEPKYGLSVFGTVHPDKVLYNRGAKPGDALVITKPIGTGIWGTALKRALIDETEAREFIESMATLNKYAAEALQSLHPNACTDITGFGLLGHLHEMAEPSEVSAVLELESIPLFEGTYEYAEQGVVPGRTKDIVDWASEFTQDEAGGEALKNAEFDVWSKILCDPQTSGGLMLSLPADEVEAYHEALMALDSNAVCAVIGSFIEADETHPAGTVVIK